MLSEFSKYNIPISSITCDGEQANQSTFELLGASLNYYKDKANFKPYFINPFTRERIYLFFDSCHMIKLVRNYFSARKIIYCNGDKKIMWSFIVNLHEKQEAEGLHCASKIKRRHVYFHREKMRVFLATQLLSRRTGKALTFLEFDLKEANFKDSGPTAEFLFYMDDIFDFTNVKNQFCKRLGKVPITAKNLTEMEKRVQKSIEYIESLEIDVSIGKKTTAKPKQSGKSNLKHKFGKDRVITVRKNVLDNKHTKVGFLGLIMDMKNFICMAKDFLEKKYMDYILTYKWSQDHLEMLFALIRRMGGFNNNPTTIQFKSAYKKLCISKTCVILPTGANCTPQDNTLLLTDDLDLDNLDSVEYGISKKYYFKKGKRKGIVNAKKIKRLKCQK